MKIAIKRVLAKVRIIAMEGSFGTQMEYYGLRNISYEDKIDRAITIFLDIHTENVVNLARSESNHVALAT